MTLVPSNNGDGSRVVVVIVFRRGILGDIIVVVTLEWCIVVVSLLE